MALKKMGSRPLKRQFSSRKKATPRGRVAGVTPKETKAKGGESDKPLGALLSFPDPKRIQYKSIVGGPALAEPTPENFTLFKAALGITNQDYGSCVGASHGKDVEYDESTGEITFKASYRFLYAMCKRMDGIPDTEGTYPAVAAKVRAEIGVPPEALFPADKKYKNHKEFITIPLDLEETLMTEAFAHRSKGFIWATDIAEIKHLLMSYNSPVSVTYNCPSNYFKTDSKGRVTNLSGSVGSHRLLITGWKVIENIEYWEVQNSWGPNFGKGGIMYMPMSNPYYEALADIDYIDAPATNGAPVNLAEPVDKYFVIQKFGVDFQETVNGITRWYYKSRGLSGHPGIDCRQSDGQGKIGDPIYATDAGKVIYAQDRGVALGNTIIIEHAWGWSHYNHLSAGRVAVGQQVTKRQRIGDLGNTGQVTGPHLHFGIIIRGVKNPGFGDFVDAAPYMTGVAPVSAGKDVCFAKDGDKPLQAITVKISNPERWEQTAILYNVPKTILGKAADIPALAPIKGFVFSNVNPSLVIFYCKLADPNWKAVLQEVHSLQPDTVPLAAL